jgi:hypothetical protein
MKTKILLSFAILLFISIAANAQISEGKYLLGGSFSYDNSELSSNNTITSNIQFGKVIKENTVVGVVGSVYGAKTHSGNSVFKVYNYSAGVFYRKYKPLGKNFYFLQEVDAVYQHSRGYNYFYNGNETLSSKSNGGMISYIPGISYSVTKRMQIELTMPNLANISFANHKTIDKLLPAGASPQKANVFSANINLNSSLLSNFGIGFKFLLGK